MEQAVFSCDYNGWADVPEEEREGVDAFEAATVPPPVAAFKALVVRARQRLSEPLQQRRAA